MNEKLMLKIFAGVVVVLAVGYVLLNTVFSETFDYWAAIHKNTVRGYVEYREVYPQSKYMDRVNERKGLLEEPYFQDRRKKNTVEAYDEFLFAYPHDKYTAEATRLRDSIVYWQSEVEKYGKNSLEQGAMPYQDQYGLPKKPKKDSNSDIVVVAPISFDMIALIKEKNENGRVVSHAYVKADSTYTFRLDNGSYQAFFYIGRGWHPEKAMPNGLKGGFLLFETYSKDDPVTLADEVITYRLSMRQKKYSTRREVFGAD
jgi:hypothetical protein